MSVVIRKKNEGVSSFDTEDMALAAALLSKGHEMICMHPKERIRSLELGFIYHFKITSNIEKNAEDWENRELKIDDKQMQAAIKNLNYEKMLWGIK